MKKLFAFMLAIVSVFLIPMSISAYNAPDGQYDEVTDPADIDYRFGGFGALEYINNEYWYVCYWEDGRKELVFPDDLEVSAKFRMGYSGNKQYLNDIDYIFKNKLLSPTDPEWHVADDVIFKETRENAVRYNYNFLSMPAGYYETYGEDGHRKTSAEEDVDVTPPVNDDNNNKEIPPEEEPVDEPEAPVQEDDFFSNLWTAIVDVFVAISNFFSQVATLVSGLF